VRERIVGGGRLCSRLDGFLVGGRLRLVEVGPAEGRDEVLKVWLCHLSWMLFRPEFGSHSRRVLLINVDEK
jgi:hypothetical protein